jgi:steroid delta-isomerase-like uncharacterized protein
MSIESTNEKLVRTWIDEVWNRGMKESIYKYMHPQCRGHIESDQDLIGPDGLLPQWEAIRTGFPDVHIAIDQILCQGEDAVFRWTASGTHTGPFLNIPPSHRAAKFSGITWTRWRGGQMVEGWDRWNAGALLQSLATP